MAESLYPVATAITALDNAKPARTKLGRNLQYRRAFRAMKAALATGATRGVVTETWPAWVKNAIVQAAPDNIEFAYKGFDHKVDGPSSVMVWWDTGTWHVNRDADQYVFLHGALKGQWDARYMVAVPMLHKSTGRKNWLCGVHLCPIKPREGKVVVDAGYACHRNAYMHINGFSEHTGYPIEYAGDFNDLTPNIKMAVSGGVGIIRSERVGGKFAGWVKGRVTKFYIPSNHPGVKFESRVVG